MSPSTFVGYSAMTSKGSFNGWLRLASALVLILSSCSLRTPVYLHWLRLLGGVGVYNSVVFFNHAILLVPSMCR